MYIQIKGLVDIRIQECKIFVVDVPNDCYCKY